MVRMPLTLAGTSLPGSSGPAISMLLISKTANLFASLAAMSRYCGPCMSASRLATPVFSVVRSTLMVPLAVPGLNGSTVRLPVTAGPAVLPTTVSRGASVLNVAGGEFDSILRLSGSARSPAAMAPVRMHGKVGDVDLVADLPEAEVSDHLALGAHHRAARHAVLLDLVAEGRRRPRRGEGHALDGHDLVEVGQGHGSEPELDVHGAHDVRRALSSASEGRR